MNLSQEEKEQPSTKLIHYIKSCKCSMPNREIVATPDEMFSHYNKLYGIGDYYPKCNDIIKMEVAPLKEYKCGYKWESWSMNYIRRINNTPDEETDFCLDFITECRTSALLLWNRIAENNIPYIHPMILIHFNKGNTTNTSLLDVNINVRSMQNFNYDDVFPEQMRNHYLWIFDTHEIDCEEYTHHTFSIVSYKEKIYLIQGWNLYFTMGQWLSKKPIESIPENIKEYFNKYPFGIISDNLNYQDFVSCLKYIKGDAEIRLSGWSPLRPLKGEELEIKKVEAEANQKTETGATTNTNAKSTNGESNSGKVVGFIALVGALALMRQFGSKANKQTVKRRVR